MENQKENPNQITTKEAILQIAKVHEDIRNRKGIHEFLKYLEESGFYNSAASTKFHGSYVGGLADHSYNLMCKFSDELLINHLISDEFAWDSVFICAIGHDLCKIGLYKGIGKPFTYNKEHPKGHAIQSIKILEQFFELTKNEKDCILYHMGVYQTKEFADSYDWLQEEYTLKDMVEVFNKNKIAKLFHFCDDMVSQFIDK